MNLPTFNIDEEQNEAVGEARFGGDTTGDEVTSPDGLRMAFNELGPGTTGVLWARIESVFDEYLLNRCARDFNA